MTRSDVADTLARWREALRRAEAAPSGSEERAAAETHARRLHEEYLSAVLRMTGHRDQVEGAIESTGRRLTGTFDVIERGRDLQRRTVERLQPTDGPAESPAEVEDAGERG